MWDIYAPFSISHECSNRFRCLEALKALLPEYEEKVSIYIDLPLIRTESGHVLIYRDMS